MYNSTRWKQWRLTNYLIRIATFKYNNTKEIIRKTVMGEMVITNPYCPKCFFGSQVNVGKNTHRNYDLSEKQTYNNKKNFYFIITHKYSVYNGYIANQNDKMWRTHAQAFKCVLAVVSRPPFPGPIFITKLNSGQRPTDNNGHFFGL